MRKGKKFVRKSADYIALKTLFAFLLDWKQTGKV